jgi:hypothetical protein
MGAVPDPHTRADAGRPSVKWGELPQGWTLSPQGSGMRLATFLVSGDAGQNAEVAIIPMVGFAGTEQQLVNMWRSQLGLAELEPAAAGVPAQPVGIGGIEGQLYEMAGTANGVATRLIVAAANRDGVNFFFKLIGYEAVVAAQREAFLAFLKGVEFTAPESAVADAPGAAGVAVEAPAGETRWQAPASWEELPATQFLLAKYRVAGEGDARAEVTVSMLAGSAGGLLPNVNRWRGQLNLGPVDEAGLAPLLQPVKAGGREAQLIELEGTDLKSGTPARMLTVVVTLPAETWFFKMTGPIPVVKAKAGEFLEFVKATRF